MRLSITTRHFDGMTDALRAVIEEQVFKLDKFFDRIDQTKVVLTEEKHRHIAEITVHLPGGVRLAAREEASNPAAAIDLAVKKLETQVKKVKERRRDNRKRQSRRVAAIE
jgi:putative sigma-54 modulation protein